MASPLPRLRPDLDIMPSPVATQPGLLLRDPFHYSEATLIVPPVLARGLACFDGAHTEADLRALLTRLTGDVAVTEPARHLLKALREAAFLDDEVFAARRAQRHADFAGAPSRTSAHAGGGYPDAAAPLAATLDGYLARAPTPVSRGAGALIGVAAPHVSPEGGIASYAAAYGALPADLGDRTFVILGTSHYGAPDRFGLTRKPFETPFGAAKTNARLVDRLARAAGDAANVEDYCHAVEHSIEFQVVFLQHVFGPTVKILPILCGAFVEGPDAGKPPEASAHVAHFFGALGDLAAREAERLFFILGVDMTHIGRRYGDPLTARAGKGKLVEVEARDRQRAARLAAGDAGGFWELVRAGGTPETGYDDLKWCGSSPLYTFARALPHARGDLLHYEQWNIDAASVVSFGAMSFRAK
ncbi:MAG TPA: AmmeMemoRadiSam system protein B [Polyangia bacterium]|nr:AmmeMemoRadiSam system protein B [Polyangia bacterium]